MSLAQTCVMNSPPRSVSPRSQLLPSIESPASKAPNNVSHVVLGDMRFKTWYPSFHPEELVGRETETLYVCQWCFKYACDMRQYLTHLNTCHAKQAGPPGRIIYQKLPYSIYEVDGEEHKLFTQNLSLFAKLFLDNKSVFFDVSTFNYYLLVQEPIPGTPTFQQTVGFFSKEKMSWDNNNLACILVFPPWQRKGLGKILMGVSYELSKRENNVGGPEKPLSELGRKSYLKFWEARVAAAILSSKNKSTITVEELAKRCWMVREDVLTALKEMGLMQPRKRGAGALIGKTKVREWAKQNRVDLTPPVDEDCFTDELIPETIDETGI